MTTITTDPNAVLSFWFGEAILSTNPTALPSLDHPTIEQSITKQYKTLWFPTAVAQAVADSTIQTRFSQTLVAAEQGLLNAWASQPLSLCALIVVLDQFSRHIYRHRDRPPQNDRRALELSEVMLQNRWHLYLPVPMEVFALMPLRHSPTIPRLERVLTEIETRTTSLKCGNALLDRFKRTTLNRLEGLKAEAASSSNNGVNQTGKDGKDDDNNELHKKTKVSLL